MKALSVWQPYAQLIGAGHKGIETRTQAAPSALIGQRIAVAATKNIKAAQRAAVTHKGFAHYYARTGLPPLDELPMGSVICTVTLAGSEPITQALIDTLSQAEFHFGHYALGRHAWHLEEPLLVGPFPCRGMLGFWDWYPDETPIATGQAHHQARP